MSDAKSRNRVRGGGSLADGRGEIAWRLGDRAGAVALSEGEVAVTPEPSGESAAGWGYETSWETDPLEGAAVFRHLAVEAPDGATIIVSSRGPAGIEGHGLERTEGVVQGNGGPSSFEEALLSTQYDGDGRPTRIGLELWPEDADQTSRAGATRVAGSLLGGVDVDGLWAGFFRCHTDGAEGLGTYLLWRP
jgi:hypothetical protein